MYDPEPTPPYLTRLSTYLPCHTKPGAVSLMFCCSRFKFDGNFHLTLSHYWYYQITTNLCTDHNSTAVVSCATFSSDYVIIIKIEVPAKRNFISNLNYGGKHVSGMSAALSLPTHQSNIDHSHHCSSDQSSQPVTLAVARKYIRYQTHHWGLVPLEGRLLNQTRIKVLHLLGKSSVLPITYVVNMNLVNYI